MAALSPPAVAAYHLLEGDEPGQAEANIAALSPQMADLVSQWKGQFATELDRTSAAIAFVQDDVRYLGIEIDDAIEIAEKVDV